MTGASDIARRFRPPPGPGGDLVLFVHGLGCDGGDFAGAWDCQALDGLGLLAPDLPGCGDSPDRGTDAGTVESHAAALAALLAEVDYGRLHIVAHSMGGAPALLLARDGAPRLASFVNIEGNLIAEDCSMMSRRASEMDEALFVGQKFARIVAASARAEDPQTRRWSALLGRCDPAAVHRTCRSLVEWSDGGELLAAFHALAVPEVYAYGERTVLPPVLHAVRGIETKCFKDTGHFVMTENPAAFYPWLAGWLLARSH
ncbi:MAG: alpha/beta hydrolase [Hyphomicrobiales bacterium]|nr:alpha/beta hydrolase [Hyphomicrobiales bacterium]MCP5374270.1 alpha/beta hydrolase [Hyphomicrobiales bacterium]